MRQPVLLEALWLCAALIQGLWAARIWRLRLVGERPFLFAYLISTLGLAVLSFLTRWYSVDSGPYRLFWSWTQPLFWTLTLLVLVETYNHVIGRLRGFHSVGQLFLAGISVLAIRARSGYTNPRLGCKVFALLSRSMLRSLQFRSLNAARSPRSSSLEGFSPTLLLVVPSSATQRLLSVAARRPLSAWHRQSPDPPQHLSEQLAVQIPLGQ